MRRRRANFVVVATLAGLLVVAAFGAWYLLLGERETGVSRIEIPTRPEIGRQDSARDFLSGSLI